MTWFKKNIIAFAALIISILSFWNQWSFKQESLTRQCKKEISDLQSAIISNAFDWNYAYEVRKSTGVPIEGDTLVTSTKKSLLLLKRFMKKASPDVTKMSFKRSVLIEGQKNEVEDSFLTYLDFLKKIETSHYSKVSDLKILRSTSRSISDLSNGTAYLLNKVECDSEQNFYVIN